MNFIYKIFITLTLSGLLFTSCKDDSDDNLIKGLNVDNAEITLGADGGDQKITISSDSEWSSYSNQPWVMLSPANGTGSTSCCISVDSTLINDVRTATIRISNTNGVTKDITINQTGYARIISLKDDLFEIKSSERIEDRYFEARIITNVLFNIEMPEDCDWISFDQSKLNDELGKGARPRTMKIRFDWSMNTENEERSASLKFIPQDGDIEHEAVLTVKQKAAPFIEDNRSGDSLAIMLAEEKLNVYLPLDGAESMDNWESVTLWEKKDKDVKPEMIGRVKSVKFFMMNTNEALPVEVSKLRYVETLSFFSNSNSMFKSVELGDALNNLKYLKSLEIFAFGLIDLPEGLANLTQLESLLIAGNNFSKIPDVLTKENFPNLIHLDMTSNRRKSYLTDLSTDKTEDMGLYMNINNSYNDQQRFIDLLSWDKLELLTLSYNYLEGTLPDLEDFPVRYTDEDIAASNDTIPAYMIGKPKVLPNMKQLSLNLNMFTGDIPDWILEHPNLWMWNPYTLIYNQEGYNTTGKRACFDNVPISWEYYYELYPLRRPTYVE